MIRIDFIISNFSLVLHSNFCHIKVTHYFDEKTNLNVMLDENGNWVGAWKLTKEQKDNLFRIGNVQ
jgi:hypothetical protein